MSHSKGRKRPYNESPCGSPPSTLLLTHQTTGAIENRVDEFLHEHFQHAQKLKKACKHARYFMLAVVLANVTDEKAVFFFVHGEELKKRLQGRVDWSAEVHLVHSRDSFAHIVTILTPHGLAAAHNWIEELNQQVGDWLLDFYQYCYKLDREQSKHRLRANLYAAIGIREAGDAGVWYKSETDAVKV